MPISAGTNMKAAPASGPAEPAVHYRKRLAACEVNTKRLDRKHLLLGLLRLVWVVAAIAAGWFSLARHRFSGAWLLLPIAAFAVTARWHARVLPVFASMV